MTSTAPSANKATVERYMQGFRTTDHVAILSCLTDDVEWILPGAFHLRGKVAFDNEIENDNFSGPPEIEVTRLVEENDVVVAQGFVRARRRDGSVFTLAMCDVFEMSGSRIRKLTSYLAEIK